MGRYLTDSQIERVRDDLALVYALPYASDLVGTAWEQILADAKGGVRIDIRDNRPRPDFVVQGDDGQANYSVKTEGLRLTSNRSRAADFVGRYEDFIVARPKVDELFSTNESIADMGPDELGAKVLQYYNERIVERFHWDVISFLLRIRHPGGRREFIYWEESPPAVYEPSQYWWQESGKARGGDRNINGYPWSVRPDTRPLPRATFKWTSGGKQFYVLYRIPADADIWAIEPLKLSLDEVREALRRLLRQKQRVLGQPPAS
jgi:hypothetical protein